MTLSLSASNDPDLPVNEEFLGVRDLGCTERPIGLEDLMNTRHHLRSIVVGNELRPGSQEKTELDAFPIRNRPIFLGHLSQLANTRPPRVVARIEPPPDFV